MGDIGDIPHVVVVVGEGERRDNSHRERGRAKRYSVIQAIL